MKHTREQGTVETLAMNGAERIIAIREVVKNKQYAKIDGQCADLFSCSAIMTVYDALSEPNQEKYRNMPYSNMASIAFKLVK